MQKKPRIIVIDYGMGNLASVRKAVEKEGGACRIGSRPGDIRTADAVILPGVGAFGQAMKNLRRLGLVAAIRDYVASARPFLGVCLGQQLFFESSEESPGAVGLGLMKGRVVRFRTKKVKVPHIGWNTVRWKIRNPLVQGLGQDRYFYFVHSYYAVPADQRVVAGVTEYGGVKFASSVMKDNLFAFQFHPEKSQTDGLKIYRNFVRLASRSPRT